MQIYQQLLTAVVDTQTSNINETGAKMVKEMTAQIKNNKSSRINGTLAYELTITPYIFPKSVDEKKIETKWESFRQMKGIKKRKKTNLEYSEDAKKWLPKWGSKSISNQIMQGGVVQVEKSISKLKREKKERIAKNLKNRDANRRRAQQK